MELRVLRYFLTVAREENITRAAESLFITQPTLSRQLIELEKELGTQLFVRGKRKVTLTEDGTLFRRRAEEMLELEVKISAEFKNQKDDLSGVISIGAAETKGFEKIPKVIDSFRGKLLCMFSSVLSRNFSKFISCMEKVSTHKPCSKKVFARVYDAL